MKDKEKQRKIKPFYLKICTIKYFLVLLQNKFSFFGNK
jgi:hypothetical protein